MAQDGAVLGGRYVLGERIGHGGYGEVWRAADTVLSRPVAVKLLHVRHAGNGELVARFRAEARLAAALSHENIAQVYDYGEAAAGQPPYLVMELVAGASLETVLADGPLDAARTMDIVAQAAAGLRAAHAAGMVHRDVKPGNLLLTPGGTVKITDFGIAHTLGSASVTATGELLGTPAYLAPERAMGERAGPASDLYALGIVAYECLTGTRPFAGPPLEVALAHRDRPLPVLPPSVGHDVATLVMRLTAKDPARRLGDAAEVTAWAGLLRDGGSAPVLSPARAVARRRAVFAYACAALAAVIVIVVASVIGFAAPSRPVAASSSPGPASSSPGSASSSPAAQASRGNAAAPSSGRPAANPARSAAPAQPSVAGPAAHPQPTTAVPVVNAVTPSGGPGKGPGGGKGQGNGNGPGNGKGPDKGKGNGHGN